MGQVLAVPGKAAGDDLGLGIENGRSQPAVLEVLERDDIARLRIAEHFLNLRAIHPLVAMENAGAGLDDNT